LLVALLQQQQSLLTGLRAKQINPGLAFNRDVYLSSSRYSFPWRSDRSGIG
jgi:hypothetical protein